DRAAHLEQGFDEVGAALGHAIGELLHRDCLWDDDVADLLGRGPRLHMVALFLFAGAAERGERAGAAVILVGKRAGDGELTALAMVVATAPVRACGFGAFRGRRMPPGAARYGALVLVALRGRYRSFRLGRGLGGSTGFFFGAKAGLFGRG